MLPNLFGTNRVKIYTLALALAVVTLACGRKEPPLPPPSLVPAPPGELRVEQRGEEVLLSFLFPTNTIGGLALDTFEAAEIYELVRELPEGFFDEPEEEETDEESEGEEGEGTDDGSDGDLDSDDTEPDSETDEEEGEKDKDDEDEDDGKSKKRRARKPRKKVYTVDKREFSVAAQVRTRLEGAELAAATEGDRISNRFILNEIDPEGLTAHVFGVKIFRDSKDLISGYSKFVTLVPKIPPPAPSALSIEATPGGVLLEWESDTVAKPEEDKEKKGEKESSSDEAQEEASTTEAIAEAPVVDLSGIPEERQILGFHIYRRLSQEPGFDRPLLQVKPDLRRFVDKTAPFGPRYVYSVTAIRELDPVIESAIGEEREVDYRDRFAPPVPRNVAALAERGRVRILWTPRPTEDLAGYLVYRIDADGTERLLTATPTIDSEYIDEAVSSGDKVSYFVVSIDRVGNRSAKSAVTETTVP